MQDPGQICFGSCGSLDEYKTPCQTLAFTVSIKARLHVLLERMRSYRIAPLSACVFLITDDLSLRLFIDWPESCETTGFSIRGVIEKMEWDRNIIVCSKARLPSLVVVAEFAVQGSEFKGSGGVYRDPV